MRKIILIIACFCSTVAFSQKKMEINDYSKDDVAVNICDDSNAGVLVFYSANKNLKFTAKSNGQNMLNKTLPYSEGRYVLCVKTITQDDYSMIVAISTDDFFTEEIEIEEIGAKEKRYYQVIADIDNTAVITVHDKDGKPLSLARICIKGSTDTAYTSSKGVYDMKLPSAEPTILVISHRYYSDPKEITVRPDEKQTVKLNRYDPPKDKSEEDRRAKEKAEAELKLMRTVEIAVLDIDSKPLNDAKISIKGKSALEYSGSKGIYKVVLPNNDQQTLVISHNRYFDSKEINASPFDKQQTVRLSNIKCDSTPAVISTLPDTRIEKKYDREMVEYSGNNGVYNVTVPCGESATIVLSHPDYFDKKEIIVRSGDKQTVQFTSSKYATINVIGKDGKCLTDAKIKICGTNNVYYDGFSWHEGGLATADVSRLSNNARAEINKLELDMNKTWYSDNNGICQVELPNKNTNYRLDISHSDYYHDRERIAKAGGKYTVRLRHKNDFKRFNFGLFGGIGFPTQKSDSWMYADSSTINFSGVAGMKLEFKLSRHISIQPELLYIGKGGTGVAFTSDRYSNTTTGANISDVKVKSDVKLHYLEIPLNLVINIPYSDGKGAFFFGAGYYFSYGLAGTITQTPSRAGFTFDPEKEKTDVFGGNNPLFSRSDHGLDFIIGVTYNDFCFFRAGYDLGRKNIAIGNDAEFKNRCFYLSVGINFSESLFDLFR